MTVERIAGNAPTLFVFVGVLLPYMGILPDMGAKPIDAEHALAELRVRLLHLEALAAAAAEYADDLPQRRAAHRVQSLTAATHAAIVDTLAYAKRAVR